PYAGFLRQRGANMAWSPVRRLSQGDEHGVRPYVWGWVNHAIPPACDPSTLYTHSGRQSAPNWLPAGSGLSGWSEQGRIRGWKSCRVPGVNPRYNSLHAEANGTTNCAV